MPITPGSFDINDLTDEDVLQLAAAPGSVAAPPAPASEVIDISKLSDAQAAQFAGPGGIAAPMGALESFGRGTLEGGTFGFDASLGLQDKAKREASKKANPWTHFAGEMVGSVVPMAGAMPLAAVKGTGLLAKGARAVGSAFNPAKTETLGQAMLQGSKVGATYAGLSGAGHADPEDTDSWAEGAVKRALGAGAGAIAGGILGAPVGAAAHGASRLIGAGINRLSPELQDLRTLANNPELRGTADVARLGRYDNYTPEDFARLRAALNDPAQAHRYEGLNLLEALEVQPMRAMPHTGELKPGIRVSPNLSAAAQDAANTEGAGRQMAREAWASRNQAMGANITRDVDQMFGDPAATSLANQFGRSLPSKADDITRLPQWIDDAFGSGASAEAREAALAAQATNFDKRYARLRAGPLQEIGPEITRVAQTVKPIQGALDYAASRDMIRLAEMGADWTKPWSAETIGQGLQTLSPQNLLDMHHFLVLQAKPKVGGDLAQEALMGDLKRWFSGVVDQKLKRHEGLRTDYQVFKRAMEAPDMAQTLPIVGGGLNPKGLQFFNDAVRQQARHTERFERAVAAYEAAFERYTAGQRATPPKPTAVYAAERARDGWTDVVERFRSTWGETLKDQIAQLDAPAKVDAFIRSMMSPAAQERIATILGPQRAPQFFNNIISLEARNQGLGLGLKAGGSDHAALQFFDRMQREGNDEAVAIFRQAWGDRIKQELGAASTPAQVAQTVRGLLAPEGKNRIQRILGEEDGNRFIEMLYNKEQQLGLGSRLYGGPDTAYKLANQKKTEAISSALSALMPWSFRPTQLWQSLGELGSARLTQNRADQINKLLSKQGPDAVTEVIDGILANAQMLTTGQPFVLRPSLRALGPAAGAGTGHTAGAIEDSRQPTRNPGMPPFRP